MDRSALNQRSISPDRDPQVEPMQGLAPRKCSHSETSCQDCFSYLPRFIGRWQSSRLFIYNPSGETLQMGLFLQLLRRKQREHIPTNEF